MFDLDFDNFMIVKLSKSLKLKYTYVIPLKKILYNTYIR